MCAGDWEMEDELSLADTCPEKSAVWWAAQLQATGSLIYQRERLVTGR